MQVLVTGGAGFIGSAFVRRHLEATQDEVVVVDKLTYAGTRDNLAEIERGRHGSRLRFVQADIADRAAVRELFERHAFGAVVNFAAETHVDRAILDPEAFLRTSVIGAHVLLEAVRAVPAPRRPRLLQVSTDEVYGTVPSGYSVESDPLAPSNPYSAAKAGGDLLVLSYQKTYGLDVVITRGANTYGPQQHVEKVVPLFVTNALRDEPLPLYGDGRQVRDWLYVDDHADAVRYALERGEPGGVYNVPGGQERTNREVAETILALVGKPWSLVRRVEDRPGHDRRYAMNGERLAALGWRPSVPFAEGMARTVEWYRTHPEWSESRRDDAWFQYYERQYRARLEASTEA